MRTVYLILIYYYFIIFMEIQKSRTRNFNIGFLNFHLEIQILCVQKYAFRWHQCLRYSSVEIMNRRLSWPSCPTVAGQPQTSTIWVLPRWYASQGFVSPVFRESTKPRTIIKVRFAGEVIDLTVWQFTILIMIVADTPKVTNQMFRKIINILIFREISLNILYVVRFDLSEELMKFIICIVIILLVLPFILILKTNSGQSNSVLKVIAI